MHPRAFRVVTAEARMVILTRQKFDPLMMSAMVLLISVAFAVSVASPAAIPWAFAVLPAAALLAYWVARWDVMVLSWAWVCSYAVLDFEALKVELPGFFTLNPPRAVFLAVVLVYLLYFLRRGEVRFDRKLFWILLAVTLYLGISAHVAGWTSQIESLRSAPYFRFLGAILLPFAMLWLVYNGTRDERQAAWPFVMLSVLGWYVLYVAYLQFAYASGAHWANSLIWPKYIVQANLPVDLERARGPFRGAGALSSFMVVLFYMNLYAVGRLRGAWRIAILAQLVLIPPAVFFASMRAGYLSFLLCGAVWLIWGHRRRAGVLKLAAAALVLVIATIALWDRLSGTDRRAGGVAQTSPIRSRKILAAQAWEIVQAHPFTGVGFGHFVDYQVTQPRDPHSMAGMRLTMVTQHNIFLTIVSEAGIIGLVGLIAVFLAVFRESLSLYRKIPPSADGWLSRQLVVVFWIMMLNYVACGMFRDMLWEIPTCVLLWSIAGLIVGYNRLLEPCPIDRMYAEWAAGRAGSR